MQAYRSIVQVAALLSSYKKSNLLDGIGPVGIGILFCLFGVIDLWGAKTLSRENSQRSKRQSIFLATGSVFCFLLGVVCFCLAFQLKNS